MHNLGVDLTTSWVGYLSLVIFVVGYYFIAMEDKYRINKAKPALFIGTTIFMLIGLYYTLHHFDRAPLEEEMRKLIVEISEIFFFLFVAMTYIEAMIDRKVFSTLRYKLVSRGLPIKSSFG